MRTKEIIITVAVIIVAASTAVFFMQRHAKPLPPVSQGKMQIVASFYPLAHFAEQVGGNLVSVTNMTPAGAEPHDYEPTPQQIANIYNAKLLIANGSGLDPWADKISNDLESKGVTVVTMSTSFKLLESPEEELPSDPHFWLDPALAEKEVEIISNTLQKIDPAHASDYQANATTYIQKLADLDKQYSQGLSNCINHDVVTSHAAFGYLARHYGLTQVAIAGVSPDAEPSPARIAEIAKLAQEKNIKYIFFETLVSPKLAETIAKEVGAQTLVFNPLEGLTEEEVAQGKTYISIMQENLTNLRTALQCT